LIDATFLPQSNNELKIYVLIAKDSECEQNWPIDYGIPPSYTPLAWAAYSGPKKLVTAALLRGPAPVESPQSPLSELKGVVTSEVLTVKSIGLEEQGTAKLSLWAIALGIAISELTF
jgi:hypothetical protein